MYLSFFPPESYKVRLDAAAVSATPPPLSPRTFATGRKIERPQKAIKEEPAFLPLLSALAPETQIGGNIRAPGKGKSHLFEIPERGTLSRGELVPGRQSGHAAWARTADEIKLVQLRRPCAEFRSDPFSTFFFSLAVQCCIVPVWPAVLPPGRFLPSWLSR